MKKKVAIPIIAVLGIMVILLIAMMVSDSTTMDEANEELRQQAAWINEMVEIVEKADTEINRLHDIIDQLNTIVFLKDDSNLPSFMQDMINEAWDALDELGFERP